MQGAAHPHLHPSSDWRSLPFRPSITSARRGFRFSTERPPRSPPWMISTERPPRSPPWMISTERPPRSPRTKGHWPTSSRGDSRLLGQPAHKREEFRQSQGAQEGPNASRQVRKRDASRAAPLLPPPCRKTG